MKKINAVCSLWDIFKSRSQKSGGIGNEDGDILLDESESTNS